MPWTACAFTLAQLRNQGGRAHFHLLGRYVTVVEHASTSQLFCVDSSCCHAAGPLGEGPVEDIEDIPCIRCPWHNFLFSLDTGERVKQEIKVPDSMPSGVYTPPSQMKFPLQPWPKDCLGPASRGGTMVQRVHPVRLAHTPNSNSGGAATIVNGTDVMGLRMIADEAAAEWSMEVDVQPLDDYKVQVQSDRPSCDVQRGALTLRMGSDRLEREAGERAMAKAEAAQREREKEMQTQSQPTSSQESTEAQQQIDDEGHRPPPIVGFANNDAGTPTAETDASRGAGSGEVAAGEGGEDPDGQPPLFQMNIMLNVLVQSVKEAKEEASRRAEQQRLDDELDLSSSGADPPMGDPRAPTPPPPGSDDE